MRISDWSSDVCSSDLFTGGRRSAQVRQAQSRSSQAIEQYIEVERGVIAQTRGAYAAWQANERIIAATRQAVSANALSLEGVRAENSVGTRSEEHTSELQSLMRISYAGFCLKKK